MKSAFDFKPTQRTVTYGDGKKITVRLSPDTRSDISGLIEGTSKTETQWITEALKAMPDDCKNATGFIRDLASNNAFQALLDVLGGNEAHLGHSSPATGLTLACLHDDEDFKRVVDMGSVEGTVEIGNVKVHSGLNEFGNVCFFLESQIKGETHLIISTPFSASQWLEAVGI